MRKRFANEIMDDKPLTVTRDMAVGDFARLLLDKSADGAVVMDGDAILGVVTSMDLIWSEKPVHMPTLITFMDLVMPFGAREAERELHKIMGATVGEIMSSPAVTVRFDAPMSEVATRMVDGHRTILPVVNQGRLIGVITKAAILRAAFGESPA